MVPNIVIVVIGIVGTALWADESAFKITVTVVESLLCFYLYALIMLASVQFKKWCDSHDETDIAILTLILAWLCLIDGAVSHIIYSTFSFIIQSESNIAQTLVYLNDWFSLLIYLVVDFFVYKITHKVN